MAITAGSQFTKDSSKNVEKKTQKVSLTSFSFLSILPIVQLKIKNFSVLFIGDDILEGLSFTEVYRSFEEMHLLNFSIRGDKTQNILWRLKDGELDNIKPKVSCTSSQSLWMFVDSFVSIVDHRFTLWN